MTQDDPWDWDFFSKLTQLQQAVLSGGSVVANVKTDHDLIGWAKWNGVYVYIGRPEKYGNPFVIGKHGTREEVVRRFAEEKSGAFWNPHDMRNLTGKVLGCWCSPHLCHGHVLLKMVQEFPVE